MSVQILEQSNKLGLEFLERPNGWGGSALDGVFHRNVGGDGSGFWKGIDKGGMEWRTIKGGFHRGVKQGILQRRPIDGGFQRGGFGGERVGNWRG